MSETWIEAVTVTDPVLKSTLVGDNVNELITGDEKSCEKRFKTEKKKKICTKFFKNNFIMSFQICIVLVI